MRRYNRAMSVPSAAAPIEFDSVGLTKDGKRLRPSDRVAQLEPESVAPRHGVLGAA
jgi:hypothetical protein